VAIYPQRLLVELMKRYSKPVYQGRRLRRMVELAEKSAKMQVREAAPLPQTQRVDRRLSAETIAELVQTYRDGECTYSMRALFLPGAAESELLLREAAAKVSVIVMVRHALSRRLRRNCGSRGQRRVLLRR
jgi:hypothetical protein